MQATPMSGKMDEGRQLPTKETSTHNIDQSVEELLRRIAEFVLRKWISEKEESYFVMLLQRDLGSSKHNAAIKYVRKKLDEIEMKARATTIVKKKTVHFLEPNGIRNIDKETESNSEISASKIVSCHEDVNAIHIIDRFTASKLNLDTDQLSNLFVEMCFFARLGFLQPPCCLYCSFQRCSNNQKAVEQITAREVTECHRYVVWRKDATVLLSPNTLSGNLLLVRCCDAEKLILGGEVHSSRNTWRWDYTTKLMIENRDKV
jgi:hypothetical protein